MAICNTIRKHCVFIVKKTFDCGIINAVEISLINNNLAQEFSTADSSLKLLNHKTYKNIS